MASSMGSVPMTASRCTPNAALGRHLFKIAGHSLHQSLGAGEFIQSAAFAVGGHDLCIVYYPNGDGREGSEGYVSVYLKRVGQTTAATQADRLVIECNVAVILGKPVSESDEKRCEIHVPPSTLSENLGKLLETGEEADVTFKVEEAIFHAHKILLSTRSPVFKAELFGLLGEKNREHITIEEMQPSIFKSLLYFMYTDSLPEIDNLGADEGEEMVKHLLVAGDRYGVERMKVMCESFLAKRLDVKSVAATLVLADKYHCSKLRDSCIEFINSLKRTEDFQASQGYADLKRACPDIIVEIWEKGTKSRKT